MEYRYYVPIKGALARTQVEAYFNVVVYARRVKIKELEKLGYDPELLHITNRDKAIGYKHVFQVDVTQEFANSGIRSPIGMWKENQIFMDNDAQLLLDHLNKYYKKETN